MYFFNNPQMDYCNSKAVVHCCLILHPHKPGKRESNGMGPS